MKEAELIQSFVNGFNLDDARERDIAAWLATQPSPPIDRRRTGIIHKGIRAHFAIAQYQRYKTDLRLDSEAEIRRDAAARRARYKTAYCRLTVEAYFRRATAAGIVVDTSPRRSGLCGMLFSEWA